MLRIHLIVVVTSLRFCSKDEVCLGGPSGFSTSVHYDETWALSSCMLEASFSITVHPHVGTAMSRIAPGLIKENGWLRMFRGSIGSHGSKISMPLLYDVRLLIYVPLVFMLVVPEPHLLKQLVQCTPTTTKQILGFKLSQERLQSGVLVALIKTVYNSSYCLPVKIIHIDLYPAGGVSFGRSLKDIPTLCLVLDVDHSARAQLTGFSNTFHNLHSEH